MDFLPDRSSQSTQELSEHGLRHDDRKPARLGTGQSAGCIYLTAAAHVVQPRMAQGDKTKAFSLDSLSSTPVVSDARPVEAAVRDT